MMVLFPPEILPLCIQSTNIYQAPTSLSIGNIAVNKADKSSALFWKETDSQ